MYETKDSGEREHFSSGMVRDTQAGKPRYDLIDRTFLRRWADLMARGAAKYGEENWRLANDEAALKRFKASALRHMFQWLDGDETEDHAAAVAFGLAGAEMVKEKMKRGYSDEDAVDIRLDPRGSKC
jgi:hypothetical protein